jgi:hypothetical protein
MIAQFCESWRVRSFNPWNFVVIKPIVKGDLGNIYPSGPRIIGRQKFICADNIKIYSSIMFDIRLSTTLLYFCNCRRANSKFARKLLELQENF